MLRELQRWRPDLADQLRRASASIDLNIGEGAGKVKPGEKLLHYRIARGSTQECIRILHRARYYPIRDTSREERLLRRVAAMLLNLCRMMERRKKGG